MRRIAEILFGRIARLGEGIAALAREVSYELTRLGDRIREASPGPLRLLVRIVFLPLVILWMALVGLRQLLGAIISGTVDWVGWFAHYLTGRSWKWWTAAGASASVVAVSALFAGHAILRHRRTLAAGRHQDAADRLLRIGNLAGAEAEMRLALELDSDNPELQSRLEALVKRESTTGDSAAAAGLMLSHWDAGRLSAAAAEAEKVVAIESEHWSARLLLTIHSFTRNDLKNARLHWSKMPPGTLPDNVGPGLLLSAQHAARRLDDSDRSRALMEHATANWFPHVRSAAESGVSAAESLILLELYQWAFAALGPRPDLLSRWDAFQQLSAAASVKADARTIVAAGLLQENLLALCIDFARRKLIGPRDAVARRAELERGIAATWSRARTLRPDDATPQIAQAVSALRASDPQRAFDVLSAIPATPAKPASEAPWKRMLVVRDTGRDVVFLDTLWHGEPASSHIFQATVQAASAAGKFDEAIALCRAKAVEHPNWTLPLWLETLLQLKAKRPADAAAAIAKLPAETLRTDGDVAFAHAFALLSAGRREELDRHISGIIDRKECRTAVLNAALALGRAGHRVAAADWAERLLAQDADDLDARRLAAESLIVEIDRGPAPADAAIVNRAIAHHKRLLEKSRDEPALLNNLAFIHLVAGKRPQEAWAVLAPLRSTAKGGKPTVETETLAMAAAAVGELDTAKAMFERLLNRPGARPARYIRYADVLVRLGQFRESRLWLEKAKSLPAVPREAIAWAETAARLKAGEAGLGFE